VATERGLGTSQIVPFLPDDPSLLAHCERVAYLTRLITDSFEFAPSRRKAIEDAALGHHSFVLGLGHDSLNRFQQDLGVRFPPAEIQAIAVLCEVSAIIRGDYIRSENQRVGSGYEILDACNFLDESVELSPYDGISMSESLEEFGSSSFGVFHQLLGLVLRSRWMQFDGRVALGKIDRLPVVPRCVKQLLALSEQDADVSDLESIAKSDQFLAATVVARANSALYARLVETKSIRDAICYLGIPTSRKVLLEACFQTLFASSGLQSLWKHATWAAETAQKLAGATDKVDPSEAYLAGLIHDIGRLVIERFPQPRRQFELELRENGFPVVYAEAITYRLDHAQLGAELLRRWQFPDSLVNAIEFHHRPEANDSVLSSLLYLTETLCLSDSDEVGTFEDLPCLMRLCKAEERTGITMEKSRKVTSPKTNKIAV